jgi:tripartite-type tricarboxylate transporter receptor subunit TctC
MHTRRTAIAMMALGAPLAATSADAEQYPSKPVRIVVPYSPGAGNDNLSRLTGNYLTRQLGEHFFVENKPGAGSEIGCDLVARARPDGYTIMWSAADGISLLPAVKHNVPYRVPEDFTFIAMVTTFTELISVNAKLPIYTLKDLVDYARSNPGKLRYGTAGVGGAPHLATLLLEQIAKINMINVPFGGVAPALTAVAGGFIDLALAAPQASKPFTDSGNVRPIAIADTKRHKFYPNVPTTAEAGMPGLVVVFWAGLMGPAGLPKAVLARLEKEVANMLSDAAIVQRLDQLGYLPAYEDPKAFQDLVVKDLAKWSKIAKAANISL